jgi:D-sedoheptulose 7-phosphate isomerase
MRIRHLILDRDGVMNEERPAGTAITEASQWHWMPGALEGLARLSHAGVQLSVATNQSGVGRGTMSAEQLSALHGFMLSDALRHGIKIRGVFVCSHTPPNECDCRKPKPKLILQALNSGQTTSRDSLVVGDDLRDLEAGWSAGVTAVLVSTGKGRLTRTALAEGAVPCFEDLPALADSIIADSLELEEPVKITARAIFAEHARIVRLAAATLPQTLAEVINSVHRCLANGHTIFACGNGGSASDAQHLVAELVGRFRDNRRALAAIALTGDSATLTAVANDFGYEHVFVRQIEALARPGDVLIAISTSGNSANVLAAAKTAKAIGCVVIGMTGHGGGALGSFCNVVVQAPSSVTARIQELHGLCIHAIAHSLDDRLSEKNGS